MCIEQDKQAGRQKKKRKRRDKPLREALLIKPTESRTDADVLKEIHKKAKPEDTDTEVRSIRQTRSAGIPMDRTQDQK